MQRQPRFRKTVTAQNLPEEPHFPLMIFMVAGLKDLIDFLSGGFLGIITSITLGLIIWFWITGKPHEVSRGAVSRWIRKRIWLIVFEFLPLTSMVPIATIMVYRAYKYEKKAVAGYNKKVRMAALTA